jgi:glycosyltransferase involved in cell wall biosynthesis
MVIKMELLSRLAVARVNSQRRIGYSASKEILLRNRFFDGEWYASMYADVRMSGLDPLEHYVRIGSWLGRNPNPRFDATWYLRRYPKVLEHAMDPAIHYLCWGRLEGRKIRKVGCKVPSYEMSGHRRYVDRKVQEWDSEREAEFVAGINKLYHADSARFDAIPVSIVMPTYNRAHCIAAAIESVIAQSHRNWSLIISDDGSDDSTEEVVQGFADSRTTYIKGSRNGVSAARNAGLNRCDGEYVFYLDSDNAWDAEHIRIMLVFMVTGGLDAAYVAASCSGDASSRVYIRGDDFDWAACRDLNFVDMNTFAHRTALIRRHGGFDEDLRRLVDWDFILRYTRERRTAFAPYIGVHYNDKPESGRITMTEYRSGDELRCAAERIRAKHRGYTARNTGARRIRPIAEDIVSGRDTALATIDSLIEETPKLRIGYVLWDWPALSQTFVLGELRTLVERGVDVKVYYKVPADQQAPIDFPIEAFQVSDSDALERLCTLHRRNALHSPFVYPAATLMAWPVAERLNIRFTLMAGGVDVAHYENMKRNRVGEMTSTDLCGGVITLGSFHRDLLLECGVPSDKLVLERQTVDLPDMVSKVPRLAEQRCKALCVARFIEKKGIEYLIRAAVLLPQVDVVIHGYGALEGDYRRLIEELGVTNVEIAGPLVTRDALLEAYAAADVFVLPCVRAANGDLDGLPTVLLESMAAGVPVVTSAIANSPDLIVDGVTGFLAQAGDHVDLAHAVRRFLDMPEAGRNRLAEAARRRAVGYAGSGRTVDTLTALWNRRKIDIVLVTYDVPGYASVAETVEIIRRIYAYTVMDFDLFVVDNNSTPEFKNALRESFGSKPNFHLIELDQNVYCGPASNVGFSKGAAEYIVYICSKEGFILQHGWDLHMTRAMDVQPRAAMGGYLVELARYGTGREIQEYPSFESWRSRDFAKKHPERRFRHVQGGVFILRRDVYERTGGFSGTVVHNGMDVEYSYYLESQGFELANITGVYAVTTKTLPPLGSLLDEHAYVVHPSTVDEVGKFDRLAARVARYCNLCGWQGTGFVHAPPSSEACVNCQASAFDRSAYRILSQSGRLQSRPVVVGALHTAALGNVLSRLCPQRKLVLLQEQDAVSLAQVLGDAPEGSVVIVDHATWSESAEEADRIADRLSEHVRRGGIALLGEPDATASLQPILNAAAARASVASIILISDCCRFDTLPIHVFSGSPMPVDLQGLDA